jgi:hypothetical protein
MFARVGDRGRRQGLFGASAEFWSQMVRQAAASVAEETVDELRRSLLIARELIWRIRLRDRVRPARSLHRRADRSLRKEDIPPLARGYGPAEIDKAILDALLRAPANFFDGMAGNIAGIDARLSRDLGDSDIRDFLASAAAGARRDPAHRRHGRQVEGEGGVADANENAGARYFKLKLNGDPVHDASA